MSKRLILIFGALLFIGIFIIARADNPGNKKHDEPVTYFSYEDGIKKAAKDSLHVAVFFETSWCGWCRKMEQSTLIDERVVELLNNHFVSIRVDGDKRKDLVRSYGVRGFPQTWFLKFDAGKIAPAPGFWDADNFYWLLRYIKDYAYEKEQFKDYVTRNKKKES